jgi:hypothetical protein
LPLDAFVGLALGQEEVTGEAALHADDISLGSETFDLFFENDLGGWHGDEFPGEKGRENTRLLSSLSKAEFGFF